MVKRGKGTKKAKGRSLFEELSAGVQSMQDHREGRLGLRTHQVPPPVPAVQGADADTAWEAPPMVYQLKVVLMETDPPIWRRLRVPGKTSLARLDRIIQTAMGWTNSHLHTFTAGGVVYSEPSGEWETPVRNERRARLEQIAKGAGVPCWGAGVSSGGLRGRPRLLRDAQASSQSRRRRTRTDQDLDREHDRRTVRPRRVRPRGRESRSYEVALILLVRKRRHPGTAPLTRSLCSSSSGSSSAKAARRQSALRSVRIRRVGTVESGG